MKGKLIIFVNVDWAFMSHRLPLAQYAKKFGYDVTVIAIEERGLGDEIRNHGFRFIALPTTRSSTNFMRELKVLFFIARLYKIEKPNIVHHVTLKPVAYGSLVAKFFKKICVVNAITGFGTIFIDKKTNRINHFLIMLFFKIGFRNDNLKLILQNRDDYKFVNDLGIVSEDNIYLIPGSGVDIEDFTFSNEPSSGVIKFLLPARMLHDKGVGEYEIATRLLYPKYKGKAEFILAGECDTENKTAIKPELLKKWSNEGHVKWIGYQKDMKKLMTDSHVIVLPSYQEGLPKSLIEACAIGRAIITTNVPGCRDVVENNVNGLLVEVRDNIGLEKAIERLIIEHELRKRMARAGRKKAEEIFDVSLILEQTINVYESFCNVVK